MTEQAERSTGPGVTALAGSRGAGALAAGLRHAVPELLIVGALAVVVLGQLAEDVADTGPLQMVTPAASIRRWTLILATLYMLVISGGVDRLVDHWVAALHDTLGIEPAHFSTYARSLRRPGLVFDLVVLAASAVVVTVLFVVLGSSLPIDDPVTGDPTYLPTSMTAALVVLAQYTLVGWAVLLVVASTVRRAVALRRLSSEPLRVDVFDTTDLLPLGNIALGSLVAPAGIIVILLLGFGRPSSPLGWAILLLAMTASVLALILPLRPIHRQMVHEKQAVLRNLNARVRTLYQVVASGQELEGPESIRLNNHANVLISLRKAVGEMTTWPFRDTLAFGRALLIASAPLIYTAMSEFIKLFWITPLAQ